jgi:hypothetical protein
MLSFSTSGHIVCRRKRLLAIGLCAASFAIGHTLFGQELRENAAPSPPSLLSQYLQAKSQMAKLPQAASQALETGDEAQKAKGHEPPIAENHSPEKSSRRRAQPAESLNQPSMATDRETTTANQKTAATPAPPILVILGNKADSANSSKNFPSPGQNPTSSQLRPAAISAAGDEPYVATRPVSKDADVQPALAYIKTEQQPIVAQASLFLEPVSSPVPTHNISDDENLPPIVSPSSVPRPGTKKKPAPRPAAAKTGVGVFGIDLTKFAPTNQPTMITNPHVSATALPAPRIEWDAKQAVSAQP